MLESPPRPGELKVYEKVRNYFASCMDDRQDQARHASGGLKIRTIDKSTILFEYNNTIVDCHPEFSKKKLQ